MPRRRSRNRRRASHRNSAIIGSIVVALAGTVAFFMFTSEKNPLDQITLCPTQNEPKGTTAIILDMTDDLSSSQALALRSYVNSLGKVAAMSDEVKLEKGTKFVAYILTDTDKPKELISICNPGTSEERDLLSEGKNLVEHRWQKFLITLDDAIGKVVTRKQDLPTSKIIESLAYVRASMDFPPDNILRRDQKPYAIIVVSNLIENSNLANHFSGLPPVEDVWKSKPVTLSGINLHVLFVADPRYQRLQNASFKRWWRQYFSLTGANLTWDTL